MGFVAAICTQCGANIDVDDSKEAGVCSHCGTAFITEKVVNNYHIHNNVTNNIEHATIHVHTGKNETDIMQRYLAHIKNGSYEKASECIEKLENEYPHKGITYLLKADYDFSVDRYGDDTMMNFDSIENAFDQIEKVTDEEIFDGMKGVSVYHDRESFDIENYATTACARKRKDMHKLYAEFIMKSKSIEFLDRVSSLFAMACKKIGDSSSGSCVDVHLSVADADIQKARSMMSSEELESYAPIFEQVEQKRNRFAVLRDRSNVLRKRIDGLQPAFIAYCKKCRSKAQTKIFAKKALKVVVPVLVIGIAALLMYVFVFK